MSLLEGVCNSPLFLNGHSHLHALPVSLPWTNASATSPDLRDVLLGKLSDVLLTIRRSGFNSLPCRTFPDHLFPLSRCLGIENKKGTLRPGADADLVVLDRQGVVLSTWVKGKQAYTANH